MSDRKETFNNNNTSKETSGYQLLRALRTGKIETALTLIEEGANPNFSEDELTCLIASTMFGYDTRIECTKALLKKGADVNAKTNGGVTALMFAAIYNNPEICRVLIENNADVHAKENDGKTALIRAAEVGNFHVVAMFQKLGLDISSARPHLNKALIKAQLDTDYLNRLSNELDTPAFPFLLTIFGRGFNETKNAQLNSNLIAPPPHKPNGNNYN